MPRRDRAGPYSLEALRALAVPEIFDKDPESLKGKLVTWFEESTGRTLYPMQVEMLLIEMVAYLWSLLSTEGELAHRQRYAPLADEAWLEQLGAGVSTPRLPASRAITRLQFTLAAPAQSPTVVPLGTRVSAGAAGTTFLTDVELLIPVGASQGSVTATAEEPGSGANGLAPGTVGSLMDPIAGVAAVANLTATDGGADREDLELYRLRVVNALEMVSEAGSRQGYAEHVMGVSSAIIDVAVLRPAPCYIDIYPLTEAGPAGPDLRAIVAAGLDPEVLRPMGDEVTVKPPEAATYSLTVNILARANRAETKAAAEALVAARTVTWRQSLGGSLEGGISASELVDEIRDGVAGIMHLGVVGLDYLALDPQEFPVCTGFTVNVRLPGDPP